MTCYLKNGSTYMPANEEALNIHKELPAGNYIVKQDQHERFFFEQINSFEIPSRIYGDTTKMADRIIKTFIDRKDSTGVLLNGEKGSGKTLLAKILCHEGMQKGWPTIIINTAWVGDDFNKLLQDISQPCIVMLDEFEKIYNDVDQQKMLTLLDGVFPSKKLFIITCNDKYAINDHMRNRPGRIYYMLDFYGLENEFIIEYCEEKLNNKTYIDDILKLTSLFNSFNFDMLKAIVEEMNRFGETPQEVIKVLNTKPLEDNGVRYEVTLKLNGEELERAYDADNWRGNPIKLDKFDIFYGAINEYGEYSTSCTFSRSDVQKIDPTSGDIIFKNNEGFVVKFSKIKHSLVNYKDLF